MNWGTKIIIVMSVFVAGILFMVITAMRQTDMQLVAPDYYEQEIAYQSTIDKVNNYSHLPNKPSLIDNQQQHQLKLDCSMLNEYQKIKGKIAFFRPSNSKLDFNTKISLDENGIQWIDKAHLASGKWTVKLDWELNEKGYYHEQTLFIQ